MATQGTAPELQSGSGDFNSAVTQRWTIDSANPVVREHVVKGRMVVPFAYWLSRSVDAVASLQAMPPREIDQILVRQPLPLDAGASVEVEFSGTRGHNRFEICLAQPGSPRDRLIEGSWRNSASGESQIPGPVTGSAWDCEKFYRAASAAGLNYGPLLQRISRMHATGSTWSAELSGAPTSAADQVDRMACWDALLQCGSVLAANGGDACWIPFRIERIRLGSGAQGRALGRIAGEWIGDAQGDSRVANLFGIAAGSDAVAVEFLGVHYRVLHEIANPAAAQKVAAAASEAHAPVRLEEILDRLHAAEPTARRQMVIDFIGDQLLEVLDWDRSKRGDLSRGFITVGLDSLMAVDLQFRLQAAFKFALPIGHNIELSSIENLADFMMQKCEEIG